MKRSACEFAAILAALALCVPSLATAGGVNAQAYASGPYFSDQTAEVCEGEVSYEDHQVSWLEDIGRFFGVKGVGTFRLVRVPVCHYVVNGHMGGFRAGARATVTTGTFTGLVD